MIVYLYLALILVNGQPELKGGTFDTAADCTARLAGLRREHTVLRESGCHALHLAPPLEVPPSTVPAPSVTPPPSTR